jgi:RNA polymerase sigma factor (sigma-70 family)
MSKYNNSSGPVYSNVSLIKKALFQTNRGKLPYHEIVLYLAKHWNRITLEEAERLVGLALHARLSFFLEDEETGLWETKKHIDTNLNSVYVYMRNNHYPLSIKELAKKLKIPDISMLMSGLSSDLRFSMIQSGGTDYWILSEWVLANDTVYNHMQLHQQHTVELNYVYDILTEEYMMDPDHIMFAPEIDGRFSVSGDLLMIELHEPSVREETMELLPEILEEIARSGILICKYIESHVRVKTTKLATDILGIKAYERIFQTYCKGIRQFLASLNEFACNDTDEWYRIETTGHLEIEIVPFWEYSVKNSVPVIPYFEPLLLTGITDTAETVGNSGEILSDEYHKRKPSMAAVHYLTYYERVRGYIAIPQTWISRQPDKASAVTLYADGYHYTAQYTTIQRKAYLFGNGIMDFFFDYQMQTGHELRLSLQEDFTINVAVGEVHVTKAAEQTRLLDIGKLTTESKSVNKSFYTIVVEVLATYPSGLHASMLFDRVNEIRSANRNTVMSILSSNECFVQAAGKKGYWQLNIGQLSRFHVDENGVENELDLLKIEEERRLNPPVAPAIAKHKKNQKQVQKKASPQKTKKKKPLKTHWDSFREWSFRQRGMRFGNLSEIRDRKALEDAVVRSYAKLVCKMASSKNTYFMERMDLVQEGIIALLGSIGAYDETRGVGFGFFSKKRILSRFGRKLYDNHTLIRIPIHAHESIRQYELLINSLVFEFQQWPDNQQIKNRWDGSNIHEMERLLVLKYTDYISFEQYWATDSDDEQAYLSYPWITAPLLDSKSMTTYYEEKNFTSLLDELSTLKAYEETGHPHFWLEETTEDEVNRKTLREILSFMLADLDERDQQVIRMRFGWDDQVERTLEEVGKKFTLTRERIRQIEARALRKLKLAADKLELFYFINN